MTDAITNWKADSYFLEQEGISRFPWLYGEYTELLLHSNQ